MRRGGFALIEVILLIIVLGLLGNTLLFTINTAAVKTPTLVRNMIALQTARKCMEWFIGQRNMNGYAAVPVSVAVPSFCTAPSGYTVGVAVTALAINSDNNYRRITVTVSGLGNAQLVTLIGTY